MWEISNLAKILHTLIQYMFLHPLPWILHAGPAYKDIEIVSLI